MDINALYTGIYNAFVADADLLAALGGSARRFRLTKAPQDIDSPYVVFQYIAGSPDLTFGQIIEVASFQFSIFNQSEDPLDSTTIDDVFNKLCIAFDDAEDSLTVSGYTVIWVTRGVSNFVPTMDDMQQYVVNYEMGIQKAR